MAIMASIYVVLNIVKLKDKEILKKFIINIILIVCISACFWMPMLETYTFAEYEVYQDNSMATEESFYQSGLDIQDLLFTSKDATHVFEIGIPILIMLCLSIFAIRKRINEKYKKEYFLFLILGLLSILITIKEFPLGPFSNVLQIIQFKWRMLLFANFFLSIICGINVETLIKNFNFKDIIVISTISILYIIILIPFIPKNSKMVEIDEYTIGQITENKGDVIIGMGRGEYLPVSINQNREYVREREDTVYITKGNGTIKDVEKKGQKLSCTADVMDNETIFEFPYIYYPGYEVIVNGEQIKSFESENGFLAISLSEGSDVHIDVEYIETKIMFFSKMISIIGIIILIIDIICEKRIKNKKSSIA